MKEISGAKKVTSVFGEWPDFHDGEVVSLSLRCSLDPRMDLEIFYFEVDQTTNSRGEFNRKNKHTVKLGFRKMLNLEADGFNNQNVISSLEITSGQAGAKFSVRLVPSFGLDLSFQCDRIEVLEVSPIETDF